MVCKVFYRANRYEIQPVLIRSKSDIEPWILLFKFVLDMQVPQELSSWIEDVDEADIREKSDIWLLKAEVSRITHLLMQRRGDPKFSEQPNDPFPSALEDFLDSLVDTHLE
jgi:hypothetical protein